MSKVISVGSRRRSPGTAQRIRVLSTDERLAKLVGAILYNTGSGNERSATPPLC